MCGWSKRASVRAHRAVRPPRGDVARQVLLDRDHLIEIGVAREVGNAEAALPKHPLNHVPMQPVLGRQGVGIGQVIHDGANRVGLVLTTG